MKKTLRFLLVSLAILLVVTGCNNEAPEEDDIEDDNIEALADDETTDDEGESDGESDQSAADEASNGEVLSLGETGLMETVIGDYEVTVLSFEFIDGPEEHLSESQRYLAVDLNIKNVGKEAIESEEVARATITDSESGGRPNETAIDIVDHFEGTIDPGGEQSGQLLFRFREEDTYHLRLGANHLDSLTNELIWEFSLEEAD
ncbi:DUF4352 domain-containing protein [Amphibacillus sp. Q70]|uniref:DUF4352 domain-containing protein n=1 Tax=Amphibacillus sp. Q70 TaxID=3453416 RepID=UPI003F841498